MNHSSHLNTYFLSFPPLLLSSQTSDTNCRYDQQVWDKNQNTFNSQPLFLGLWHDPNYIPRHQSCVQSQQREALICHGGLCGKNQVHINPISSKVQGLRKEWCVVMLWWHLSWGLSHVSKSSIVEEEILYDHYWLWGQRLESGSGWQMIFDLLCVRNRTITAKQSVNKGLVFITSVQKIPTHQNPKAFIGNVFVFWPRFRH